MAEAQGGGPEDVAGRAAAGDGAALHDLGQVADQLAEGLGRAPVFLLLVAGQLERDDRDRQADGGGHAGGIVLDQFGGAGGPHDHRLGLEPGVGVLDRGLEQLGRVGPEVAGLEGCVGHRRTLAAPLDHREQQIRIGVALRGVQDVVQAFHGGRDPHRADVGRAFIGPDGQLHDAASRRAGRAGTIASDSRSRRFSGRANSSARSAAWSKPCTGEKTSSIDHLVVRPSISSGLARPRPQTDRSGRASRHRSSWRSTSWPSLSTVAAGSRGSSFDRCGRCR